MVYLLRITKDNNTIAIAKKIGINLQLINN